MCVVLCVRLSCYLTILICTSSQYLYLQSLAKRANMQVDKMMISMKLRNKTLIWQCDKSFTVCYILNAAKQQPIKVNNTHFKRFI